jgi:uncharacterized repeat protein (TIGR01451 family)
MKHRVPPLHRLTRRQKNCGNRIIPRNICNGSSNRNTARFSALAVLTWLALLPALSWAQCNTSATTTLSFTDANPARPAGENWNGHLQTGVPEPLGVTRVSSSVLTGGNATSSLVVGTLNNAKTLAWSSDFSAANGVVNVTFTFTRPLSNFTVDLADIDASRGALFGLDLDPNYTDQVVVTGANAGTATPLTDISLAVAGGTASNVAIAGNTATGVDDNNANTSATVRATFASPITSLTLSYRSGPGITDPDAQTIGINQMTWCRLAPLATNVTTTTVPSTAVQTGISPLASAVDGAVQNYFITSLPTRGTLFYNSAGTTYTAITSIPTGGFSLTPAQANSLRYTPDAAYAGNVAATFGYRVRDDAALLSANTATYTIPLQPIASCGANPGTTTLAFGGRPVGEDWMTHAAEAVPAGSTATLISSGNYQTGAATASLLEINTVNSPTLTWNNDYAAGSTKTSQVTFSFTRPLSNFTVQVQDIDAGGDFIDQVTFQGNNGTTPVTPLLTAANPGAGITTISGNVATGQNITGSPVDGTVTAYFSAPITSLTIIYNNATAATDGANQLIGIDQMTWCRALPTAVDVTSAALLNSIGTAGISPLASLADNVPVTYTLTSVPTAAQGVLSYNSGGTTYTNIAAAGQVLTAAQAASLRFTPTAGFSGNATFTYRVTDALNNLSTNTATYTMPVVNAPCLTATAELNFRTSTPVPDDWKAHAAVPVGNSLTTVGTSNYQIAAGATTNTFSVLSGTATNNINGVQTLAWVTDYANQTNNTASVTFNFSQPVSNYSMRVQDIDRNEVSGGAAFIDQVTFAGSNGGTPVLPALTAAGTTNTVLINGNVATGTTNVTNTTDGTVMAYFASPITSLTLTYRNTSTSSADPTVNGIGIELLNFCRLAPVAANVTNASRPSGQGAAAINPLSASAPDGTITSYTIAALPDAAQGTFFVNGVALTASTLTLTPAQAAQLSFAPAAGFSGNAGFSYTATDNAGVVSNVATYAVPVTNTGAAGTPAPCATAGKDGSPTISSNPDTYYPSTAAQTLAVGATTINVGTAVVGGTTTTPTSIVKGDLLLVIQMQGADINFNNSDSYGDGTPGGGASGNLASNFTAGTYEYVVASNATPIAAATGGAITLASPLVNSYVNAPATTSAGPRRFQVIRVPQYGNLTLGGTLAATPWNGSTGGVLVLDVAGQTNFSGNTITAAGRGFRGGGGRTQGTLNYDSPDYVNVSTTTTDLNAQKGEGTAGTPRYVNSPTTVNNAATNATIDTGVDGYPGGTTSRGAPGNAGGGGNDNANNSGGGGGANGGTGGRGGDSFSGKKAIGGEPGASFAPASSSRLVLGGGGGAGSTNNSTGTPAGGVASSGAAGGGIVILRTGTITGTGSISANGGNANNSAADDGGGGGGAGGSILVTATSPAGLSSLMLSATGGTGGSNTGGSSGPHGPGGGGGGGVILTNGAVASASAAGAASGTTQGTPASFGAAAGLAGVTNTQISSSIAGSTVGTTCAADVTTILAGPATLAPAMPSGTYTVTFANEGPSTATSVVRQVTLPAGATNIIVNGAAYTPTTTNTIDFGQPVSLTSGAASTFTFSFTPATTATGSATIISNVTTASGQGADAAPNSSTINATIPAVANVATTIAAGTPVAAGTPASVATAPKLTVNFTNNGPSNAAGVVAAVQLPKGLTNVTATGGGSYSATTGLVTYPTLTGLATGTTTQSLINFDAPLTTPVAATASISTTTSEAGQTADNQASAGFGITPAFDLATTLSGPASSVPGDLVMLALSMTNNGPGTVANALQTAQLPTGLSSVYVSNGGFYNAGTSATSVTYGGVSYSVPAGGVIFPPVASLPGGQSVANTVSFAMPGTAFKPTAAVSSTGSGETSLANNTANLNGALSTAPAATLNVATPTGNPANVYTKLAASTTVAGTATNVTLTVTTGNNGGLNSPSASNVVQTVQLLPGLSAANLKVGGVAGTPSGSLLTFTGASYDPATGVLTFNSTSLTSGTSVSNTITFAAPVNVGNNGQLLLTAAATTSNADPVPADNLAAATVVIAPTTDLTATLTGPATATVGQLVTYTASFTNSGPMTASGYNAAGTLTSGVFETAQLPVGLASVAITDAAGVAVSGATYSAATGLVTFPSPATDPAGTTQVYNLTFAAPATGLVVRSNVGSASLDPTPANNGASVATTLTPAADLVTTVAGPALAPVGNPVTYILNTTNNGPSAATAVAPTLQLPLGFTASTLQVNGTAGTLNGTIITFGTNGPTYDTNNGLVTFPATGSLAAGANLLNRVTFLMPNPASGQVAGLAAATSATMDLAPGNNAASVATSIAPATTTTADLSASVSGSPSPVAVGSTLTLTAEFRNNGPDAATSVAPTLQLAAGLTVGPISNGGTYNATTGLVTWPVIESQPSGDLAAYTVQLTAPASASVIAVAAVSSATSEPATNANSSQTNNSGTTLVGISPAFDLVTRLSGPAQALPGASLTYTVTTVNNGPSATPAVTTQTVQVPAGQTPTAITNGGVYSSTDNTITWTLTSGQASGSAGAIANSFTLVQPAAGLALTATSAATGEGNAANNGATAATTVPNQPPTASAMVNALQSPEGNTAANSPVATTGLLISPLATLDPENALSPTAAFTIVAPATGQGTLYYNNNGTYTAAGAGQQLTAAQAGTLRFLPALGYVGNATFTYLATDNAGNQSAAVSYTVPVGADLAASFVRYNTTKGGTNANKYLTNDVLVQFTDLNAAVFSGTGTLYDTQGVPAGSIANGLSSAVLTSGTLPTGVSLDPATGRIYVSNASLLVNNNTAQTYSVTVTTTDLNGGVTQAPVSFTIGAYPLPVVLTAFTATAVGNRDAQLSWTTASETNSAYFTVERSFDGSTFTKVGQVAAQGTSVSASTYAFADKAVASLATGAVYYRLRQVDLDGTAAYSPVRTVRFTQAASVALSLYPNPAVASTTLDLSQLPTTGTYQVQLLDATGRLVRSASLGGGLAQPLDLHELATGTYHVLVTGTLADGTPLRQTLRLTKE